MSQPRSNFAHLARVQKDLAVLGTAAERYLADDPNTSLLKLRQFDELMAQQVAARVGAYAEAEDTQAALLQGSEVRGWLPGDSADLFHWLRKAGNAANYQFSGDHRAALNPTSARSCSSTHGQSRLNGFSRVQCVLGFFI